MKHCLSFLKKSLSLVQHLLRHRYDYASNSEKDKIIELAINKLYQRENVELNKSQIQRMWCDIKRRHFSRIRHVYSALYPSKYMKKVCHLVVIYL